MTNNSAFIKNKIILSTISLFFIIGCGGESVTEDTTLTPVPQKKNIIIFLTDDQRADTLKEMPIVREKLLDHGIDFTNAIVTNPECCPFRASMISGGYHTNNTGVLSNGNLNGGRKNLNESNTIATKLSELGYRTGYVGRYMHGYGAGQVPLGWDFLALNSYKNTGDYFNLTDVTFLDDGEVSVKDVSQYVTDFHAKEAINFINKDDDRPFLLIVGLYAPHGPFKPDIQDIGKYAGYSLPLTPQFGEDVSDKPNWVQRDADNYRASSNLQNFCTEVAPRGVLELLQSADRAIGNVVDAVSAKGYLKDTIIFMTSDNGRSYGEHDIQCDKGHPYEEALRVPFIVRSDDLMPGIDDSLVAANLDIGATIFKMLGLPYEGDGVSLVEALSDRSHGPLREHVFIENFGYMKWRMDVSPIWNGLRSKRWKYVEHGTGEVELYDLLNDSLELTNLAHDGNSTEILSQLSNIVKKHRGISIVDYGADITTPILGEQYYHKFKINGGTSPFKWSIAQGQLPNGITLDANKGILSGVLQTNGVYNFTIQVSGSRIIKHGQRKESFKRSVSWGAPSQKGLKQKRYKTMSEIEENDAL